MDAEITKGEPFLCPWPQISDNDHECERSESCKLNTMPRAHLVLLWHCKNWREAQKRHQSSAPNEPKLNSYGAISTWAISKAWEERIMSLLKRSTQQNNKAVRFKTKKSPKTQLPKFLDNSLYSLLYLEHRWLEAVGQTHKEQGLFKQCSGQQCQGHPGNGLRTVKPWGRVRQWIGWDTLYSL